MIAARREANVLRYPSVDFTLFPRPVVHPAIQEERVSKCNLISWSPAQFNRRDWVSSDHQLFFVDSERFNRFHSTFVRECTKYYRKGLSVTSGWSLINRWGFAEVSRDLWLPLWDGVQMEGFDKVLWGYYRTADEGMMGWMNPRFFFHRNLKQCCSGIRIDLVFARTFNIHCSGCRSSSSTAFKDPISSPPISRRGQWIYNWHLSSTRAAGRRWDVQDVLISHSCHCHSELHSSGDGMLLCGQNPPPLRWRSDERMFLCRTNWWRLDAALFYVFGKLSWVNK